MREWSADFKNAKHANELKTAPSWDLFVLQPRQNCDQQGITIEDPGLFMASSNNIMKRHVVMLIEVMKQPISKKRKGSHYSQVSEGVFSWTVWPIRLIFILLYLPIYM